MNCIEPPHHWRVSTPDGSHFVTEKCKKCGHERRQLVDPIDGRDYLQVPVGDTSHRPGWALKKAKHKMAMERNHEHRI